jgi:hypothetical protein
MKKNKRKILKLRWKLWDAELLNTANNNLVSYYRNRFNQLQEENDNLKSEVNRLQQAIAADVREESER